MPELGRGVDLGCRPSLGGNGWSTPPGAVPNPFAFTANGSPWTPERVRSSIEASSNPVWRPTELLEAFRTVGFTPSLSKVAAMWSGTPVTVRLDDLDKICAVLNCTVGDLLQAEPLEAATGESEALPKAVGAEGSDRGPVRPTPRRQGSRRSLPPN